jgi:D-serine deaminase-like pyridoxal phosphate-dependent protein
MTAPVWPTFLAPAGVETPAVCVDLSRMEANIARVADQLAQRGVDLRPHAKTHKSVNVAHRQLAAGAVGITTATLGEAEVMAAGGVADVFVAYPLWPSTARAKRVAALAEQIRLRIGVDSVQAARRWGTELAEPGVVEVLVEVDSGERRTGVLTADDAADVADAAADAGLRVVGVFTHGGHSYAGASAVSAAADDEVRILRAAADTMRARGHSVETVSAGSTPTALLSAREGVTEERPGTFVFGDRQQVVLGAHPADSVALFVAATVVSVAVPGQVVLDSGAKVLTKDKPLTLEGFGALTAYPEAVVTRVYDHHALVDVETGAVPALGEVVTVIPNHVCPVVNTVDSLNIVDSTGHLLDQWSVDARGRNT